MYSLRNPPCSAEDNLNAEYIIIEDWFRGYCGSPGLGGPRASGLLMWAGLMYGQDTSLLSMLNVSYSCCNCINRKLDTCVNT